MLAHGIMSALVCTEKVSMEAPNCVGFTLLGVWFRPVISVHSDCIHTLCAMQRAMRESSDKGWVRGGGEGDSRP